jgi:hypothetical protein
LVEIDEEDQQKSLAYTMNNLQKQFKKRWVSGNSIWMKGPRRIVT